MSLRNIEQWLFRHTPFIDMVRQITENSVRYEFPSVIVESEIELQNLDRNYLLTCASVLAISNSGESQSTALRIATYTLLDRDADLEQKDAALLICQRLHNRQAINLAERRQLAHAHFIERLPFALRVGAVKDNIDASIFLESGDVIWVNQFQGAVWNALKESTCVSISAPTSSGKSFILKKWLETSVAPDRQLKIVYLVPTRALIHEVETELREHFLQRGRPDVTVSSMPMPEVNTVDGSLILVFTQERFHLFASRIVPGFHPHILIVDEAQKIGDNTRGVLLQQVIDNSLSSDQLQRIVYASPQVENPEILLKDVPRNLSTKGIESDHVTVCQNLLWAIQKPRNARKWTLDLVDGDYQTKIGSFELKYDPSPVSKRLPFVAHAIGGESGGNIVYVNGAADAEKAAAQLCDLLPEPVGELDEDIAALIALVKRTVHTDYSLARVLWRGVAFHYGNMPQILRLSIEKLFRKDKLKFLVCTSTLLEGVNLPCRSIFVRGPQKGRGKPMSPADFWNLAGRAGRWGTEFQGNIVCVDPDRKGVWKESVPRRRTKSRITRIVDRVATDPAKIFDFISKGTPRIDAAESPQIEHFVSYAWQFWRRNKNLRGFPGTSSMNEDDVIKLEAGIAEADSQVVEIPDDILTRNPGISPLAMKDLLTYFNTRDKPIIEFLPAAASSNDAVDSFIHVLGRIDKYLSKDAFGGNGRRQFQLALLIVDWMRGYPLGKLIGSRLAAMQKRQKAVDKAKEIRSVMADVENVARFLAPKYIGCYVDLLNTFYVSKGENSLAQQARDITLHLELGASTKTQMSLMALGLTRTTALEVAELIADSELDQTGVLTWLSSQQWESIDIPTLMKEEIQHLIQIQISTVKRG